jgi:hypothetical protein
MQQIINQYIGNLKLGRRQSCKNLDAFALLSGYATELDYLTLDEALAKELIDVVEVSGEGSVPELKVDNKSDLMVLILDGEELVGARQNRIVNTTILVAGNTTTVIPVSCVEQGRWAYRSDKFSSEMRLMASTLRARKADQVKHSLKRTGNFGSNQGAIWEGISMMADNLNAESPSMAMSEIYLKKAPFIQEYLKHFDPADAQVGAVFMINGKVAGMDCFGTPETFAKVFKKLVESYALDAIDLLRQKGEKASGSVKNDADKFL